MKQRFWLWIYRFAGRQLARKPAKTPTIIELEAMLNAGAPAPDVVYLPDGSLTVV